jgi:hypothetical protein
MLSSSFGRYPRDDFAPEGALRLYFLHWLDSRRKNCAPGCQSVPHSRNTRAGRQEVSTYLHYGQFHLERPLCNIMRCKLLSPLINVHFSGLINSSKGKVFAQIDSIAAAHDFNEILLSFSALIVNKSFLNWCHVGSGQHYTTIAFKVAYVIFFSQYNRHISCRRASLS